MKDTVIVQPDEHGNLSKFKINDQEFTADDLIAWKNGHMMQSDYTRKTQELAQEKARLAQERMEMQQNVQQKPYTPDSTLVRQVAKLELEVKLDKLKARYPDFDEGAVLDVALRQIDSGIPANLVDYEAIWLKIKPAPSQAEVEAQLRKKILQEYNIEDTTIIGSGASVNQQSQTLTQEELEICKRLSITPEEYLKYK